MRGKRASHWASWWARWGQGRRGEGGPWARAKETGEVDLLLLAPRVWQVLNWGLWQERGEDDEDIVLEPLNGD